MKLFQARPAIIVDALPDGVTAQELTGKQEDRLLLKWEQRRWMRGRFTTERGREIGVALPTGIQIEPGRVLWIGPEWYLAMAAAPEALLAIHPYNREDAIHIAFEVGNLHFPLAVSGDDLLVPDDSAMVQLLSRLGTNWERCRGPFQPIGKGNPHGT
jgi:urease accessory protein UreE